MPEPPTEDQRDRALARLRILTPAQAIRDPELNQALAPFRGRRPIGLVCANATCTRPFLWCGLDATTARVRFSPDGPPDDGTPSDAWEPREDTAVSIAPPGEPLLRWRFGCPRCERPCVLSNGRMITLILRALTAGHASIRPAAQERDSSDPPSR